MPRVNSRRLNPSLRTGPEASRLIRAFSSDAGEIQAVLHPVQPRMWLYLLTALVVGTLGVANMFEIDRVVESFEGHIVTVQPTILLEALDPSIIKSIEVEEGQIVKKGQLLETLDPTFTSSDARALQIQIASLNAEITRDEAELAGQPLVYPPTEDLDAQKYQAAQTVLHIQRMQQYEQQLKGFDEQVATFRATIAKLREDEDELERRKAIASRVEKMFNVLQSQDSGSQLQLLQAQDGTVQVVKQFQFDKNSISETEHSIAATLANREAFIQAWLASTSQDLVTSRNSRDSAVEQLEKAARHTELTRITAPDDCIVLRIPHVSVGSVVTMGAPIVTLALMKAPIEVEIAVMPRDIGFVRRGDEVTVKLDAYEFFEHGSATGKVRWISEGTFNEDLINPGMASMVDGTTPQPYYKVRVELQHMDFFNVPNDFRLLPGMTLAADIHVGERHLLRYLLAGLVRSSVESMREPQ